jgi:hypothetical protein
MALRLTTAAAAVLGAAAFGAAATLAASDPSSAVSVARVSGWLLVAALSLGALTLLTVALAFGSPRPIVVPLGLLGLAWLIGIAGTSPWRSMTPLAGGWLLAVAELAYWSTDLRILGRDLRGAHLRRASMIAMLVVASAALAFVPELSVSPPITGLALTAMGLLGALALAAAASAQAWRLRQPRER